MGIDTFIGVDPGGSGAIVFIETRIDDVWFVKCKETEGDLHGALTLSHEPSFAMIEKVSSMPGQGVSSTFKFGQSYGFLRGLLIAHEIPFETVTPGKWQKEFGLIRKDKNESGTDKKNRHKARAQELFPSVKVTHANADALLIAEYCRRVKSQQTESKG